MKYFAHFFKMHLLKSNESLFSFFHEGQLKTLGQFETECSSFQQVAHVQKGLKKLFIFRFTSLRLVFTSDGVGVGVGVVS